MARFAALIFALVTTMAFLFEGVAADSWFEPEIMDQRSEPAVVYGESQDAIGRELAANSTNATNAMVASNATTTTITTTTANATMAPAVTNTAKPMSSGMSVLAVTLMACQGLRA